MLSKQLFYCKNRDTYPPYKKGLYMEEWFFEFMNRTDLQTTRKYIPCLWTNFQIEKWFPTEKERMQKELNMWVQQNPSDHGYFTVVQHDDGPKLALPENTIIYGACSGNVPLPLIYQDTNNTLITQPRKTFNDKEILCSFVGCLTHGVRHKVLSSLKNDNSFKLINSGTWTPVVNNIKQSNFINVTINSKFALAPRGYGRSSFRFFEIFQLGTIPIYVWDDKEWLPYKDIIDYSKFCISIHISKINELKQILLSIDEITYNNMMNEYEKVKYLFELEGMTKYIVERV